MKNKKYLIIVPVVVLMMILSAFIMRHINLQENGIAIIGGADGPTSVFIAGKLLGGNGEDMQEEMEEENQEEMEESMNPDIRGGDDLSVTYISISMQEAKECFETEEGYLILDVRRKDEYEAGHIPGALLLPNESIGDTPPEELPDMEQTIYVYCRSGNRSKVAAEKLANMGYTNIIEIGGILDWNGEMEK